jgi:His-Xaa-Ser system radical SAM maturase HxsC
VVAAGDVIRINERSGLLSVLFRRGSRSNSLFVTERCNSYCLMCSQPPIERDDSHRVEELLQVIPLIDPAEATLGVTGGEPTLLGPDLIRLLTRLKSELPNTRLHVLTNGRRFADSGFAREISNAGHPGIVWAVPLYSDAPEIHDYVVQRRGAFSETLHGLMNLSRESQQIELRVVLQQATVPRLRQLAHFITRNLSFVDHVAWMGLEPMGFAKPNWDQLWIEPEEYAETLRDAVEHLHNMRIATSIYNIPLCVLPEPLRAVAVQSISDWKNSYLPECSPCFLKKRCAGFFSSVGRKHVPRNIRPVTADVGTFTNG